MNKCVKIIRCGKLCPLVVDSLASVDHGRSQRLTLHPLIVLFFGHIHILAPVMVSIIISIYRVDKIMIDEFLVRKNILSSLHDMWSRRGLGWGLLDHMVVIWRLILYCRWYRTRNASEKKEKSEKA